MTQELMIWLLSAELVLFSWLMVLAIPDNDRRSSEEDHAHDTSDLGDNGASPHHRLSHRGMAA